MEAPFRLVPMPQSGGLRVFALMLLYLLSLALATLAGMAAKSHTLNSLYAEYTPSSAYVSVGALAPER